MDSNKLEDHDLDLIEALGTDLASMAREIRVLRAEVSSLSAQLVEARTTGICSSGGKSEVRVELAVTRAQLTRERSKRDALELDYASIRGVYRAARTLVRRAYLNRSDLEQKFTATDKDIFRSLEHAIEAYHKHMEEKGSDK